MESKIRELEAILSKLNPMAEEFVPRFSISRNRLFTPSDRYVFDTNNGGDDTLFMHHCQQQTNNNNNNININNNNALIIHHGFPHTRKKTNFRQGKRRINNFNSQGQFDEIVRRTVCVSEIDHQVTEEQLAAIFIGCGQVVDCRICGDPNSVLKFAFIEFTDEEGARNAMRLTGTMLGFYPVRVAPAKTAITPVNAAFLPRSEDEREMCSRTIYCTHIDKKVTQSEVKLFFDSICGEVRRLKLLGDYHHSSRIAFVEFVRGNVVFKNGGSWRILSSVGGFSSLLGYHLRYAKSAIAALNCSGAVLGSLPIRVSPSKTPVRPCASPRPSMQIMQ